MALRIYIDTIPHSEHRYPTVGDYWETKVHRQTNREVRVSDMENVDYELMVAIHEAIEQHLCLKRGITEESITAFDTLYEENRPDGDVSEPGNDPLAPYYNEHQFATKIERMICEELGVNWDEYDAVVNAL